METGSRTPGRTDAGERSRSGWRTRVLHEFNDTRAGYSLDLCLHQMIEAQVERTPHATALVAGDVELDFATLNARANRLARYLRAGGVQPDSRVAICVERGWEMVVGLLAIMKSGAAYVPLDPHYPRDRLAHMLSDSAPVALLTQRALSGLLEDLGPRCPVLDLSDANPPWAGESGENLAVEDIGLTSRNLIYVIYTSGSTGLPKGVMVEHRSVVNRTHWLQQTYGLDATDAVLQKAPVSFDASVTEIFWPLTQGARLVLARPEGQKDPAYLVRLILEQKITTCHFIPSMLLAFLRAEGVSACATTLRRVMCGGEALGVPVAERFHKLLPGVGLFNQYGPTETTVTVTFWPCRPGSIEGGIPIGHPIANTRLYLLDEAGEPVRVGEVGELYVGGVQVARGYLNREELTAERFLPDPFAGEEGARMYRTGDLGRWREDGSVEYLGRNDFQVKVRGFRIELGEVEARLLSHPSVVAAAAAVKQDDTGENRLLAYYVSSDGASISVESFREFLSRILPEHMLPSGYVRLDALPLTPSGKLDRNALPDPGTGRPDLAVAYEAPAGTLEEEICAIFSTVLHVEPVGRNDNFFDLGGSSLHATQVLERLRAARAQRGEPTELLTNNLFFRRSTPAALAAALEGRDASGVQRSRLARCRRSQDLAGEPIAIIAMAGRFPGAADVETFWRNLCEGRDTITHFRPEELDPSIPADERNDPSYVPARGVIADLDLFDAAFFGITPREAELMDPQQRIFLELAWECLERAGYVPDATQVPVAVFAGTNHSTYLHNHIFRHPELIERLGMFQTMMLNDKGFVATRVAHKLNLTGPALTVHTSCSTSLVAICQAVNSLRAGQCDMALAGAASATCPPNSGYRYTEGGMLSPDGRTRTFDKHAAGTVFSDGAGVVLLKRLSDALADGDTIYAVIRGVAINNDGGHKASYTAPSSEGQAAVISMALADAGVSSREISYVEAHGTATPVGDPIEIEGLTTAFRQGTSDTGFCRIGSLKSNMGHLVIAAGVAGVIKTALAMRHERIPPTIHYTAPNPAIDFTATPFVVNSALSDWKRQEGRPRLAGVSSFGVGGTNAHVVMEEAPSQADSEPAVGPQLLTLSARTPTVLQRMAVQLADFLDAHHQINLADVAWTLAVGRKAFAHRVSVVAADVASAAAQLRSPELASAIASGRPARAGGVVFLFPGQGSQYAGMGRMLHATEPVFREAFDACAEGLRGELGFDLRDVVFGDNAEALLPTSVMQPAIFAIEYSLARLWMSRGIRPVAMLGHSIGEFAAAAIAGIFTLEDTLKLVARRGRLMQAQPPGGMLSVRLPAEEVLARLPPQLSLAAENSPGACVVSGPAEALAAFQAVLEREDVACRPLHTSHAFHSAMMDDVVAAFRHEVTAVERRAPGIPIISTATATQLDADVAVSPDYWALHLRVPVRFSAALLEALKLPAGVLLEVGPRTTLAALARQHPQVLQAGKAVLSSLAADPAGEVIQYLQALGQLWSAGVDIDVSALDQRRSRRRVCLPTYAFERQRYWVEAAPPQQPVVRKTLAANPSPIVPAMQREERLVSRLRELFRSVAGLELTDPAVNFCDAGFDSLMLTQVAVQLKKEFGVKITFLQLMREYTSLAALAARLAPEVPDDTPAARPATAPEPVHDGAVVSLAQPAGPVIGDVAAVMERQLQLMSQQLALLSSARGGDVETLCRHIQLQHEFMKQQLALITSTSMKMPT